MTEHILKTLAPFWEAVERGDKTFEVRRDDRGFQRDDVLVLRRLKPGEMYPETKVWWLGLPTTFYDLRRRITYVMAGGQFGIEAGYVVLGLGDDA